MKGLIKKLRASKFALKAIFFTRSSATVSVLEIDGEYALVHIEGMDSPQWLRAGYPPYGDTLTVHFTRDVELPRTPSDATEALLHSND
jgi:hypothetical protein